MKKLMGLLLSVVIATSLLTGCFGGTDSDANVEEGKGMKIAIVSSPSGVDDGNFNEDNYNGILKFIEENTSATVVPVQEKTGAPAESIAAVEAIVSDYDVIVVCGFQFAGIGVIAKENPDVKFILVDSNPTDADGNEVVLDNIYAMTFAEQESGFLVGMAAALETKSNKVAVVNGVAYPTNVNYQYGFESGVNYVNKKYNKSVELIESPSHAGTDVNGVNIGGNYIGSFSDPTTGKVLAKDLIGKGVDIIFTAAGGSGNGVFTAAKEAENVKVIGCDVDQYDDGKNGDSNIILTSALKIMGENVYKQLNNIRDGKFKGANEILNANTNSINYEKGAGRNQMSDDTIAKIDEAYKLLQDGTIIPAANFNDMTPESFTGL